MPVLPLVQLDWALRVDQEHILLWYDMNIFSPLSNSNCLCKFEESGTWTDVWDYANLAPGNYSFSVKDLHGCTAASHVTINAISGNKVNNIFADRIK